MKKKKKKNKEEKQNKKKRIKKQNEKKKKKKRRKNNRRKRNKKNMKEFRRWRNASYGSHESCKSLSEELSDYYGGRHRSHTRPHSQRTKKWEREKLGLERKGMNGWGLIDLYTLNVLKIEHVIYKVYSKKLESRRDEI